MQNIKISLAILLMIFSSMSALSQTYDYYDDEINRVQLILRGGVNASTITKVAPNQSGKEKIKAGYNIGILADVYISGGVFIQSGALLTTKGAKIKAAPLEGGEKADLTLDAMYIQIPLLFAFKLPAGEYNRFNLAIGPYLAYGVGGKIKGPSMKTDAFGEEGICNKSVIGLSTEIQYETQKLFFFFGTDIGFTKMMKKTDLTNNFRPTIKNYGFNLGMGYKF